MSNTIGIQSNIEDDESEIIFDETGRIKFATLNALVTYLTTEVKKNKDINENFDKIFIRTFKLYCSPLVFLELLIQRIKSNNPDSNELMVKLKIHDIIKIWLLNNCDKGDEQDEIALKRLVTFINNDVSESDKDIYEDLLTIINNIGTKNLYEIKFDERTISTFSTPSPPLPIIPKNLKRLTILDIDPLEMARQLTILESKLFKKIMPGEFLTKDTAKNIKAIIKNTNNTSYWIMEATLNQTRNKTRSLIIKHFISVANECRKLNNFSSMVGIISGLTSFEVFRLKNSGWNALNSDRELIKTFDSMNESISPTKNYQDYRTHLNNTRPPLVPFLGVHLTDIKRFEAIEDDNIDFFNRRENLAKLKHKYLCYSKSINIFEVLDSIKRFQSLDYNLKQVDEIQEFVQTCLKNVETDDSVFERKSYTIEPK